MVRKITEYRPLYEMANLSKKETGLPLDIWIDSARDGKMFHIATLQEWKLLKEVN